MRNITFKQKTKKICLLFLVLHFYGVFSFRPCMPSVAIAGFQIPARSGETSVADTVLTILMMQYNKRPTSTVLSRHGTSGERGGTQSCIPGNCYKNITKKHSQRYSIYHKRKLILFEGPFKFFSHNYIVTKKLYIGFKLKIEPREAFTYIIC